MSTMRFVGLLTMSLITTAAAAAQDEGQFFDSAGVPIHYIDMGLGEPVVLMHGLNANYREAWLDTGVAQTLLDAGFRVLALDARAHGKSGAPHEPEQYGPEMALDIVRLLDHVGVDKAHVVGYSMGAQIAGKLLVLHPERLVTLCLGGAGWVQSEGPEAWQLILADSLEAGGGFMVLYNSLYPDWSPEDRENRNEQSLAKLADIKATVAMLRGWNFFVPEETLHENTVPTLAIIGGQDPMKPTVEALQGVMQKLQTVVIPGADHLAALGHPEYIVNLVTFLQTHTAK
jgi:pimeloyl-ACP methyl ester carboxylesterase